LVVAFCHRANPDPHILQLCRRPSSDLAATAFSTPWPLCSLVTLQADVTGRVGTATAQTEGTARSTGETAVHSLGLEMHKFTLLGVHASWLMRAQSAAWRALALKPLMRRGTSLLMQAPCCCAAAGDATMDATGHASSIAGSSLVYVVLKGDADTALLHTGLQPAIPVWHACCSGTGDALCSPACQAIVSVFTHGVGCSRGRGDLGRGCAWSCTGPATFIGTAG
jgi:hypothetical protein